LAFFAFFSLMLLETVSLLITRFKLAIHAFKDHKCPEEASARVAHSEAASAHDAAYRDHQGAYDRYVELHQKTPLENESQLSKIQKALVHHVSMRDHHERQNEHHVTMAKQHGSNSELCIGNRCKDALASRKAALKSATSARKSSSHANSAVNALNHAEQSRSHWTMGKSYLGDALHYTHKPTYETSRRKKMLKALGVN
jgi:hypothetical protein